MAGIPFGEVLTLCMITAVVSLKNRKVSFTAEAFSLLPADYGVREEDCLEMSITKETEVEEASLKASEFCLERGQGTKLSSLIGLSVDEMAENIVTYGFNKERRENSIDIRLMIKNNVPVLRIRDNCRHFDPVKYVELHRDDDPTAHIGIRMVMAFVKDANYTSSLGLNNLTLTF